MEVQELVITKNTRYKLKDQMEKRWIEIPHGQDIKFKINNRFCIIVSFGTHLKNSNGLTRDRFQDLESSSPTDSFLRGGVDLIKWFRGVLKPKKWGPLGIHQLH